MNEDYNRAPVVRAGETEIARASLARVSAAVEAANSVRDLQTGAIDATYLLCQDLLMALEPITRVKLPNRENKNTSNDYGGSSFTKARRDSHLIIDSPEVEIVMNRYEQLSFTRQRCYVRGSRAGMAVMTYDIIVPTWNGSMLYDPRQSWGGSDDQWMGFRPSTGPTDVHVLGRQDHGDLSFPMVDAKELPDKCAYKLNILRPNKFKWAVEDPEWQTTAAPDIAVCRLFIMQTKTLLTELKDALEVALGDLQAVLDTAAGKHLLGLEGSGSAPAADSGPAPAAPPSTTKPADTAKRPARGTSFDPPVDGL